MGTIKRNGDSKLKQTLLTPASQDNGIKINVFVVLVVVLESLFAAFFLTKKNITFWHIIFGCNNTSSAEMYSSDFSTEINVY